MDNSIFNWYKFHELGCKLCESGSEENLRTAINRFYYGSFCCARDYLITNKIFYNVKLKKELCSDLGRVHGATRLIFLKEKRKINSKKGKDIYDCLNYLRQYRNKVDYESNIDFDLNYGTNRSLTYFEKIFNILNNL